MVTHCVWPVSVVFTLWFLLSLFCGVYTCSCGTSCCVTSVNSTSCTVTLNIALCIVYVSSVHVLLGCIRSSIGFYRRHSFRKKNQPPKLKPKSKHPIKVHVWAGISKRGATRVCIFEGKMDADFYLKILKHYLLPFIESEFPSTHRFMQDNDPKHTSRKAKAFFAQHDVNSWPTPPESPDLNPIENVWHEMKEYLRREVKPKTKEQLIEGIEQFWSTFDAPKCCRYINHLHKVIPQVIDCVGCAGGY